MTEKENLTNQITFTRVDNTNSDKQNSASATENSTAEEVAEVAENTASVTENTETATAEEATKEKPENDFTLELEEPATAEKETVTENTEAVIEQKEDYEKLYKDTDTEVKKLTAELATYKGNVKHEAIKHLQDYLDKGGSPADYYRAQTIDVDTMPEDALIEDYYKRSNPKYDEYMIKIGLEDKFGVGENLDEAIKTAREDENRAEVSRLITIKENRTAAVEQQKAFMREQKNALLEVKPIETDQSPEKAQAIKAEFDKELQAKLSAITEVNVGNYKVPVKQGELLSGHIILRDKNTGMTLIGGDIDDVAIEEALFLRKNIGRIIGSLEKKLKVEAEIKADETFNHSQSTQMNAIPGGQSAISIRRVS